MIRLALALLIPLAGCAGNATYSVEPFYQPDLKQMVCCRASAQNGKDISSLTFDLSMAPGNTITVHFSELGVGATAPITAQSQATTAIAGAVSNAAAAIVKIAP